MISVVLMMSVAMPIVLALGTAAGGPEAEKAVAKAVSRRRP